MTSSAPRGGIAGRGAGVSNSASAPRSLPVHGHVIREPSHILFIGRNTKMKAMVVIFRQGHKAYIYSLGDSFHPRLCCDLAKHPAPGEFINAKIKQFPVRDFY